jgi:hypothetical protein
MNEQIETGNIFCVYNGIDRDTFYKRQATQHNCLPSLLRDVDKGIKIVNGEGKNICTSSTEQPKQNKNILYQHDKPD